MIQLAATLLVLLRDRVRHAARDDEGATAIEWAIFAILALAIAGLVGAAITTAVRNRTSQIS